MILKKDMLFWRIHLSAQAREKKNNITLFNTFFRKFLSLWTAVGQVFFKHFFGT